MGASLMPRNQDAQWKRAGEIQPAQGGNYEPEAWEPVSAPKKPTRDFCKTAAKQLLGVPFAPTIPQVQAVVVDEIHKLAESETHCERIVYRLLEIGAWPTIEDVRTAAHETRSMESRPDPECAKCGGCGFRHRTVGGYEGSTRCDCWRFVRRAS
jgi:hypothetical protein